MKTVRVVVAILIAGLMAALGTAYGQSPPPAEGSSPVSAPVAESPAVAPESAGTNGETSAFEVLEEEAPEPAAETVAAPVTEEAAPPAESVVTGEVAGEVAAPVEPPPAAVTGTETFDAPPAEGEAAPPAGEAEASAAPAEPVSVPEAGAEAPAAPAETVVAPGAAAEAPAEAGTELIELGTERALPTGVEVAKGSGGSELITITLDNVPLQDVIRMFTRISGANIVAGTNLQGNVTVSLQNVEWKPAMNVILDSVNMVLVEKTPGIYSVISRADLAGEPVTMDTIHLKYVTATTVVPIVQRMLISTNASVSSFPAANAIVVQETATRLTIIKDVVDRIDRPRPQVFIEAKFVELNDQAIKDLGVNWEVLSGYTIALRSPTYGYGRDRTRTDNKGSSYDRTITDRRTTDDLDERNTIEQDATVHAVVDSAASLGVVPNPPVITYGRSTFDADVSGENFENFDAKSGTVTLRPRRERVQSDETFYEDEAIDALTRGVDVTKTTEEILSAILSAEDFALTLSALKQNEGVAVVSNPRIVVASGETAKIHVGRNEPNVVAQPQGDNVIRYAYALGNPPFIEIGVKVDVTPTVNTASNITVKITPELSRKLGEKTVGEAGISFPVTQIRRIITEFNLESGKTVAIGGLTSSEDREIVKKVPLLGDIPIIGKYLFRHTHTERIQDEVVIFVTVGLARPEDLTSSAGIPSEGRLIHRHLAREAGRAEAAAAGAPTDKNEPTGK